MAKSYLFKYDLMALFGNATTPPTHPDELLKSIVKSIATYKLLLLANPNVHLDLFLADYKESIKLLCDIRDGKNNPQLPYAVDDPTTDTDESNQAVQWNSNVKRNNHG